MFRRAACEWTPERANRRGLAWIVGSFVLCPCHLPITLGIVAVFLSGTALGALLFGHLYIFAAVLFVAWLAGTLHGFNLMRRARLDSYLRPRSRNLL